MACTLLGVITCGIILASFDFLHGLTTLGSYVYKLRIDPYLCPLNISIEKCHNTISIYEEMYELRMYIGIGEGSAGALFAIFYIIALVKRKPSLTWFWCLKSCAIIAINIYYLSFWLIIQDRYDHIDWEKSVDKDYFIYFGLCLTLAQIIILVLYCLISGIFIYKVCEERTASKISLRHGSNWSSNYASDSPLDNYDEEEPQYLNRALTNSNKTLPVKSSRQSLTNLERVYTFEHSPGVQKEGGLP